MVLRWQGDMLLPRQIRGWACEGTFGPDANDSGGFGANGQAVGGPGGKMTVVEFIKKWGPDPAKSPDEFLSFNDDLELLFKRVVPDVLLKMNAIKKIGEGK